MPATPEDKRQAASMAATLSAQLITAALGMIALQGAYVAFAADKKQCGITFWTLMLLAFLAFIASVFWAGKGTAELYKRGAKGHWEHWFAKRHFVNQTLLCFTGILLFNCAVCVARKDKSSPDTQAVQKELETTVQALEKQARINEQVFLQLRTSSISSELVTQFTEMNNRLNELESAVAKLRDSGNKSKTPLRSPKSRPTQVIH